MTSAADLAAQVRAAIPPVYEHLTARPNHAALAALDVLTERLAAAEQGREEWKSRAETTGQWRTYRDERDAEYERRVAAEQDNERLREKLGWYERTQWVPRLKEERDGRERAEARVTELERALDKIATPNIFAHQQRIDIARAVLGSVPPHEETAT